MTRSKPNVVMMVMDDQRFDSIGALGNPNVKTPFLNRLVEEGVSFTHTFCTVPICTPGRAELLTGCQSFANGVTWFGQPIDPGLTLLPRHLQLAGYHTIHVGKWHNDGHPREKGYDRTRCVFPQDNCVNHFQDGKQVVFESDRGRQAGHATEVFVDAAIDELDQTPEDKPFFLYVALTSPHDPFDSPEPFASMYSPDSMPLPPNYMPEHPFDNGEMQIRDEMLEPWPRTQEAMRRYQARYYGMISHHDRQLNRILEYLEKQQQLDNTVIVFTSDHGLAVGSHGLLGKENLYEHSVRVPLIWRGPGVPRDTRLSIMAHHVDLLPTLCELIQINCPQSASDGNSLVPAMFKEEPIRDEIFCAFRHPVTHYSHPTGLPGIDPSMAETQRMIRNKRWKLIFYPHLSKVQLFDLQSDPHELCDLALQWRYLGLNELKRQSPWSSGLGRVQQSWEKTQERINQLLIQMEKHMKRINDPSLMLLQERIQTMHCAV